MDARTQISTLEVAFLSSITTEFPGRLTKSEKANLHAYLVLSHSVLEEDIESVFEEFFDLLGPQLAGEVVPSAAVSLAFAVAEQIPDELKVAHRRRDTAAFIRGPGRKVLEKAIAANNGLKEENLAKLAKAVGVNWAAFEQALGTAIADLSTFGTKRGSSSHLSPFSTKVTAIAEELDPEDVKRWVRDAVAGAAAIRAHLLSQAVGSRIKKSTAQRDRIRHGAPRLRVSRSLRSA
ncbi:hypothetical protein J2X55_000880 [Microbacterium sp. 1154]|uniref:HEPN domain-containing protein n=1 Tax=Microbacterium sp. 1154 TaxID=2817733 RepID=UPI00286134B3|nr:HEPN domain-containing protein [Microbacterium sp. 1154]MDR6689981.1 hypothetical protein [Microbacterium sp. 1154]